MLDKISTFLFPTHCISCKKYGDMICNRCSTKLRVHPYICPVCHKRSDYFQVCKNCKVWWVEFDGLDIVFYYDNIIKKLLLQMKYYHKYSIVDFFVKKLTLNSLSNPILSSIINDKKHTLITYVPSHRRRRYMVKWYNQAQLLASWFAEYNDMRYADLFKKIRHTRTQAGLDRRARLTNLSWSFALNQKYDLSQIYNIIIIDDVTTTWSTINQLAKLLKSNYPALKVRWVVIGRNNR